MTRGGPRPNSGRRLYAEPLTRYWPIRVTDTMDEAARHVAAHERIPLAELVRSAMDRRIAEHRCEECGGTEGEER